MKKIFNNKNQKQTRKNLRQTLPQGEIILWSRLKNNRLGYKFRRQHGIGKYIVDFYCPKIRLVIEVDGWSHTDHLKNDYEKQRIDYIKSLGITIKRFWSEDIFNDLSDTMDEIWWLCRKLDKKLSKDKV